MSLCQFFWSQRDYFVWLLRLILLSCRPIAWHWWVIVPKEIEGAWWDVRLDASVCVVCLRFPGEELKFMQPFRDALCKFYKLRAFTTTAYWQMTVPLFDNDSIQFHYLGDHKFQKNYIIYTYKRNCVRREFKSPSPMTLLLFNGVKKCGRGKGFYR